MLHLILVLLTVVSFLTLGSWRLLRLRTMPEGREKDMYVLSQVKGVFRRVLSAAGVTYEVEGLENIPEDEAVLYVGNHRSFFDIVIGYSLVKGPTGFISKDDLEKVPLLPRWMKLLHCQFIDRDNLKQNLKIIINAIKLVKTGTSIWIYPEGTRSKGEDERDMLSFKEGSFKIAEKSGCKVIPVAMLHTRDILEAHFPWISPVHVRVKIGKPILLSELPETERKQVGAYTRGLIVSYLDELQQEEKKGKA